MNREERGHAEYHDPVVRRTHRPAEARDHRRDHRGDGEDRQDDCRSGPDRLPGRREGQLGRQRQAGKRLGVAASMPTDARLRSLAEQLDGGMIPRRQFLRKSAILTGGTAAGLAVLRGMATAQPKTRLRIWLFKSYVTGGNDILAKHVEAWAKERNVEPEFDWATFGDREQKFVAAIEAGNPPDVAEMNYQGPMRYKRPCATRRSWPRTSPLRAAVSCRTPLA